MPREQLNVEDIAAVLVVQAAAPHPKAILEAVEALARRSIGCKGLTMFRYLPATGEVERLHSSDVVAYPLGGRKRVAQYPVNQAVLARGDVYIARDAEAIRGTYKDAEKIFSLGVTSIMNVPVRLAGRNIGAMNLFGEAGWFDDEAVRRGRILAGLMAPALMSWPDP